MFVLHGSEKGQGNETKQALEISSPAPRIPSTKKQKQGRNTLRQLNHHRRTIVVPGQWEASRHGRENEDNKQYKLLFTIQSRCRSGVSFPPDGRGQFRDDTDRPSATTQQAVDEIESIDSVPGQANAFLLTLARSGSVWVLRVCVWPSFRRPKSEGG